MSERGAAISDSKKATIIAEFRLEVNFNPSIWSAYLYMSLRTEIAAVTLMRRAACWPSWSSVKAAKVLGCVASKAAST